MTLKLTDNDFSKMSNNNRHLCNCKIAKDLSGMSDKEVFEFLDEEIIKKPSVWVNNEAVPCSGYDGWGVRDGKYIHFANIKNHGYYVNGVKYDA